MTENAAVHLDAFNLLCDDQIGRGMSRVVYSSRLLPHCVVKVEPGAGEFQNVIEWETWQRVRDTKFARWFAPCLHISACGAVLIMERTTPAASFPERMPAFLTDFKRTNYGLLGGRLVSHDYGTHCLMEVGMTTRMRKAEWSDA